MDVREDGVEEPRGGVPARRSTGGRVGLADDVHEHRNLEPPQDFRGVARAVHLQDPQQQLPDLQLLGPGPGRALLRRRASLGVVKPQQQLQDAVKAPVELREQHPQPRVHRRVQDAGGRALDRQHHHRRDDEAQDAAVLRGAEGRRHGERVALPQRAQVRVEDAQERVGRDRVGVGPGAPGQRGVDGAQEVVAAADYQLETRKEH